MSKTVVISQSNYLPWKGFFDLIRSADEFVLLDSVQYTRRDWRNRNIIKTPAGPKWLTIAVEIKGRYLQSVDETRIADPGWAGAHIRSIELNYKRAAAYHHIAPWLFAGIEAVADLPLLSEVNESLLRAICRRLGLERPFRRCTELLPRDAMGEMEPTERLVRLCLAAGATRYLSGPAAKAYLDPARFAAHGIELAWMEYGPYPPYPQLWGEFDHRVSVIDLLMNTGDDAITYL